MPSQTPKFDAALKALYQKTVAGPRTCEETGEAFDLSAEELEICKSHRIPPPRISFSAGIRHLRSFIAGFDLFRRTMLDGKTIISMYDPESPVAILPQTEWHKTRLNDAFFVHGRVYDPNQSFFA